MTYEDLIAHFKSQVGAARAIGLKQPSVARWKRNNKVPELRQRQYEEVTGGALKREVA